MKKKSIILLLVVLINLPFLYGCKVIDNITPKPEDYIQWDGNYFYYANYRCKTDMTKEEEYLSSISIEGIEYKIKYVEHYKFDGNKIHMISSVIDESVEDEKIKYVEHIVYIIYSFEKEQVEYVYKPEVIDNDKITLCKILSINNEYTILQYYGGIVKLDHNTNEIKKVECESYEVNFGYIVIEKDNMLFTTICDDFEFKQVECYNVKQDVYFKYYIQNIEGHVLLQIIESSIETINNISVAINSLSYYDFESNKYFELLKLSDKKKVSMDINYNKTELFIIGEGKWVNYSTNGTLNPNIVRTHYIDNNVLYTVTVKEDVVELKPLYTFPVGEGYSIYKFEDNVIHLNKTTLSKIKDYDYYLNITTSITYFRLDDFTFLDNETHPYDNKIIVGQSGDYLYYLKVRKVFSLYMSTYAYYLYQYDMINNEENLLAFYKDSKGNDCRHLIWYIENYDTYYNSYEMEVLVRDH